MSLAQGWGRPGQAGAGGGMLLSNQSCTSIRDVLACRGQPGARVYRGLMQGPRELDGIAWWAESVGRISCAPALGYDSLRPELEMHLFYAVSD